MEPEVQRETKLTGNDSPSPHHPVGSAVRTCNPLCSSSKVTEANTTDNNSSEKDNELLSSSSSSSAALNQERINRGGKPFKKKGEETLVLKMNDGRTVTCQLVCDGQEKYLKEIPNEKGNSSQKDSKMSSSDSSKPSSFSRSSQFVSSVNSLLEESGTSEEQGAESFKRSTLELFEPIPSRLLKNQPNSQQWTEQGRRLASFVEDSIYRSLKSNDADVVKEWQLKMSSEAFQERLLDESRGGGEKQADKKVLSESSVRSNFPKGPYPALDGEHPSISPHTMAESSSVAKNGKISLLDVLREKLRRTLLNYDQQIKQDSQSVTRSIDTLFFSPAVESTTPDSQSAMPSSSDDVFGIEEPPYGYCDGDSGSNSTDESCSDRPSSTQSSFPPSSSKSEGGAYQEGGEVGEGVLDLSCSSQKGKEPEAERRKRPSTSDFSLERILARPDPKPKQKHNPFMQTFSDLLDLPPREIKNKEPFKVKRRPYRRRRGIHHGQFSKHSGGGAEGGSESENGMGSTVYEGSMSSKGSGHVNPQAPIGYLAITEDEYQRSLANASGSTDADWPSVALLMNVYSEWKLKNRGITPPSPLSGELGGHSGSIPGMASGLVKSSLTTASPPPAQRDSPSSQTASHRSTSCSSDCSSRSAGHVYSKKSRLLQNVERSCSCKSHSRKVGHPEGSPGEESTKSSIRSLLDEERMEKKRGRVEPSNSEDHQDSDSEERVKRPRVMYRNEGDIPLKRDPDGQGVCVIS